MATFCNEKVKEILEPPIKRWIFERSVSRSAFEDMYSLATDRGFTKKLTGNASRVFYPHGDIAEDLIKVPDNGNADDARDLMMLSSMSLSVWVNELWGSERVVALYPPKLQTMLLSSDWWRSYSTRFVRENLKPWAVYLSLDGLSDPNGDQSLFEGAYAGFDFHKGKLKLFCQHITKAGKIDPYYLHEFDFSEDKTLGEVLTTYRYDSPYRDLVKFAFQFESDFPKSEKEFNKLMDIAGKAIAERLFPLLLALISDDSRIKKVQVDMKTYQFEPVDGRLPERDEANLINDKSDVPTMNVFVVGPPQHDSQLN